MALSTRVLPVLAAAGLLAWWLYPSRPVPAPRAATVSEAPSSLAAPGPAQRVEAPKPRATRSHYRLVAEFKGSMGGQLITSTSVAGAWLVTELAGGRSQIEFKPERVEISTETAPATGELSAPFVIARMDGVLAGIGFQVGASDVTKNLLSSLATTLQLSLREGDSWEVQERELTGSYKALYSRKNGRIHRSRGQQAGATEEQSEFAVDERGLVSARVQSRQRGAMENQMFVEVVTSASLVRESVEEVPQPGGLAPEIGSIAVHLDQRGRDRRAAEVALGGASAREVLSGALKAARMEGDARDARDARGNAMIKLAALTVVDPKAARQVADVIKREANDPQAVGVLTAALASSEDPSATDALSSLLSEDLPPGARQQVLINLGLARTPTEASAAALKHAMNAPGNSTAAMALGTEARHLGEDNPTAQDAIDTLLERYATAQTPGDKLTYLMALANTANRRVLPVMTDAMRSEDYSLARAGVSGLALIPGEDVDELLAGIIHDGSLMLVEAIFATGHRSSDTWRPRLISELERWKDNKRAVEAITAVLNQWAHLYPANGSLPSSAGSAQSK